MIQWLSLVIKLTALLHGLLAAWRSQRERKAGRLEAVAEQQRANDVAVAAAADARRRRGRLDADPGGVREDDGFRRD